MQTLVETSTGRQFRVVEVRTLKSATNGERKSFVTLVNTSDPTMVVNSVNEEDLQDWFHSFGIVAHARRFEGDRIEDLKRSLRERREDCFMVREHLVPLLEHEYPYNLDIRGDTSKLRAGFVAGVAADCIKIQTDEIERLGKMVEALKAEVSHRSGVTRRIQQDLELALHQLNEARADAGHWMSVASGGGEDARDWS